MRSVPAPTIATDSARIRASSACTMPGTATLKARTPPRNADTKGRTPASKIVRLMTVAAPSAHHDSMVADQHETKSDLLASVHSEGLTAAPKAILRGRAS